MVFLLRFGVLFDCRQISIDSCTLQIRKGLEPNSTRRRKAESDKRSDGLNYANDVVFAARAEGNINGVPIPSISDWLDDRLRNSPAKIHPTNTGASRSFTNPRERYLLDLPYLDEIV